MPKIIRRPRSPTERTQRAAEWARWFTGDRSITAYRRELAQLTGLGADLAWELVSDLAPLLVERVPAQLGAQALLATVTLVAAQPKPREAGWALLATVTEELTPAHARTVLETLALGWQASSTALTSTQRRQAIERELRCVIRRLAAGGGAGLDALSAVVAVLGTSERGDDSAILESTEGPYREHGREEMAQPPQTGAGRAEVER
ncbi:hypothetical protein [Thermomicrobium sp.]